MDLGFGRIVLLGCIEEAFRIQVGLMAS